jgi:hypothetical protein
LGEGGNVGDIKETRNAYRILPGICIDGKNNIKMVLIESVCEDVDWIG